MYSYILFDLDGTISDSKLGITNCVQYALKSFGIEEPDRDKLEPFIGPPLRDSFMQFYGFTPEQAQQAVNKYRERYNAVGKFENKLYPGMEQLLKDLKAAGCHLAVASSKPRVYVEEILRFFRIRQYFDVVAGSELNGVREKKEEVISYALFQLFRGRQPNMDGVVMVGDRKFDVEAAKMMGLKTIGVTFGYASPGELEEAAPDKIVGSVAELKKELFAGRKHPAFYARAIGAALGSMALYYAVSMVISTIGLTMRLIQQAALGNTFYDPMMDTYFVNGLSCISMVAGLILTYLIWRKTIVLYNPERKIDKLSLIPMAVGAAAISLGLNGLISLLELYRYSPAFQEVSQLQTSVPLWMGVVMFGVLAPLVEESIFRGVVYGKLRKIMPVPAAIILSGLCFGLFHGNMVQAVYATALGIVMALIYEIYDSLWVCIAFHSIANLAVYLLLDIAGLGNYVVMPAVCAVFLVMGIAALVFMVLWQRRSGEHQEENEESQEQKQNVF